MKPLHLVTPNNLEKPSRRDGVRLIAQSGVRRLLELGLPPDHARLALDVIVAHIENYSDRLMEGEWEPR